MATLTYIVMYVITIYVVIVSYYLAKKTSSLIPVVPIAAMYYWSLYGVWSWIPMKLRGERSYTEEALFAVNIDDYYLLSVVYYSLFIVIFTVYECHMIKKKSILYANRKELSQYYLQKINQLSSNKLYNIGIVFLLAAFIFMWFRDLATAFSSGQSAYQVSRWETGTGGAEYLSMFLGHLFIYLTIPLVFVTGHNKKRNFYLIMIIIYYGMNFLLGNRSILLCSLVLGVIIYGEIYGLKKLFRLRNLVLGVGCLLLIQLISVVRGLSINAILTGDFSFTIGDIFQSLAGSSEKEAAQVSMYGTLKKDVPFTFGSSVLFLISTIIPSFLGIPRPERVYTHYIEHTVPSGTDVGWTINHVTAWYINFGIIGIILGALLWGYTLKLLFQRKSNYIYMYGAALFSSSAITMIRDGGIECYKGALLLNTIIPMLIVWFSFKKIRFVWGNKNGK